MGREVFRRGLAFEVRSPLSKPHGLQWCRSSWKDVKGSYVFANGNVSNTTKTILHHTRSHVYLLPIVVNMSEMDRVVLSKPAQNIRNNSKFRLHSMYESRVTCSPGAEC